MMAKQKRLIFLLAALALLLAVLYFVFLKPMLARKIEEKPKYDRDGDLLHETGRPFVYPPVDREDLAELTVTNAAGSYTLYRDEITREFVFKGAERLLYDRAMLSALYVQACYMLSIEKIAAPQEDLSVYGLSGREPLAKVEIKTVDGQSYTVAVGDKLVTGGAYYAKNADKPYIYALSADLEKTLLADLRDYLTPLLVPPVPSNDYAGIDQFRLYKNGELFMKCDWLSEQEREKTGEMSLHRMVYPAPYPVSSPAYMRVLETFIDFTGINTVAYHVSKREDFSGLLSQYGLDRPSYEIRYRYDGAETFIIIGDKEESADAYYAYSPETDLIVLVSRERVGFLEWELIEYIDRNIFQRNINSVGKIEIESPGESFVFLLEGEGDSLFVSAGNTAIDTGNFRQLYLLMLRVSMQGYAGEISGEPPLLLTMRITGDTGEPVEYRFYSLSTRRCFYTINGAGEFYVNRDDVDKIIANAKKAAAGEPVSAGLT